MRTVKRTFVVASLAAFLLQGCFEDDRPVDRVKKDVEISVAAIESQKQISAPGTDAQVGAKQATLADASKRIVQKVKVEASSVTDQAVDLCEGLISDNRSVVVPTMAKPTVGKAYKDPVFGSTITRISNSAKGEVAKPMYSTIQAWNADESFLILYHTGSASEEPGHHLYDGSQYKHLRRLDITAKDIENVFWHHTDPNTLFYTSAYFKYYGQFIRYDVNTGKKTVIASFDKYCGRDGVPVMGNDVMMPSWDDDTFGFRCNDGAGQETAFVYHPSTDETSSTTLGEGTPYQPWYAPMPTPSGNLLRLNGYILDAKLKQRVHALDLAEFHSHSSIGQLGNGHDALFATAFDPSPKGCDGGPDQGVGSLVVHDLVDKTCRVVIGESTGHRYPGSGTHVSAVGHKVPGWVLMSTISYGQFEFLSNNQKAPVLLSEIYLANTDPKNPKVCRIAHHRSFAKDSHGTTYSGYLGEPHATLSPSGTRLIFGSDWHDSGSVDAYVVELPVFKK